jgi:hypothetical protein
VIALTVFISFVLFSIQRLAERQFQRLLDQPLDQILKSIGFDSRFPEGFQLLSQLSSWHYLSSAV